MAFRNSMSNANYSIFRNTLDSHHHFVIVPHLNPDGDAIGSALGIFHLLKCMGKSARVISPDDFPSFFNWMPGAGDVMRYHLQKEECEAAVHQAEVLIFVDFNTPGRLKDLAGAVTQSRAFRMMIDHHPDPDPIVDLCFSDTRVSSTCELTYRVIQGAGCTHFMTSQAAMCLYTGIVTDTGGLSYNSSLPETYRTVADLLAYGFDKNAVHQHVFNSNSFSRMRLLGHALSQKMTPIPGIPAAYITLEAHELSQFEFQNGDTEGFVNYPLSIAGMEVSVFLMEKDGRIKCSFRSRGSFPVNEFSARHFSGGGHRNAAGGEFMGTMQNAVTRLLHALPGFYAEWIQREVQ